MSSTTIGSGSTFTDVSTKGPTRNFNTRGTSNLVVVFEAANASNATAGARIKDPADPTKDLGCIGAAAHSLPITDAAPFVRAVVLQGTASAIWMDDAPMPATGPAGPQGTAYNPTATKTANYTASAGELVECDPSSAGFTVTLPAAEAAGAGARVAVKNVTTSTNAITIGKTGSDTVDGSATGSISSSKGSAVYISDGVSNWMKL